MKLKAAFLVTRDGGKKPGIGDCIVITFNEEFQPPETREACIVIDGGYSNTAKVLKEYLEAQDITKIDLMVASHIDDDHINGLRSFIKEDVVKDQDFNILNYWGPAPGDYSEVVSSTEFIGMLQNLMNQDIPEMSFVTNSIKNNEELYKLMKEILPSDRIHHPSCLTRKHLPPIFRRVRLDVLAPDFQIASTGIHKLSDIEVDLANDIRNEESIDLSDPKWRKRIADAAIEKNRTANNQSIVFKLVPLDNQGDEIPEHTFLFTGDAEHESWDEMIRHNSDLKAKYLKVSHHGSHTGTTQDVLTQVEPACGIICAGRNKYDLPDEYVFKLIRNAGFEFYCTGRDPRAGKGPCADPAIQSQCARWDDINKKEVMTPIVFELDTVQNTMQISGSACKVNW